MIEIFDNVVQGTPEWFQCRMGIPTASCFDKVLAKPQKGKTVSLTRRRYLYDLAGELITHEPMWSYSNDHMVRGTEMEDEARRLYCFAQECDVQRVGFVKNHKLRAGVSPDSLIGEDGGVEIKTKLAPLAIECLLAGDFPAEHRAQCQGFLLVTGREWIDLVVYWPKIPLFVKRTYRDEAYLKDLAVALDCFNEELDRVVDRVQRCTYSPVKNLKADLKGSLEAAQ